MRKFYDNQLELLDEHIHKMGYLCNRGLKIVRDSLKRAGDWAKKSLELDEEIDQMEHDIETLCLKLLLKQQPVAGDLRRVSSALKMITDLERVGDQASDIAEMSSYVRGKQDPAMDLVFKMLDVVEDMIRDGVASYVDRDLQAAQQVIDMDDVVDQLFEDIKRMLIERIAAVDIDAEFALDVLMIVKYLERIGDHATNVAEWAQYALDGTRVLG